jgi:hypothetical protein
VFLLALEHILLCLLISMTAFQNKFTVKIPFVYYMSYFYLGGFYMLIGFYIPLPLIHGHRLNPLQKKIFGTTYNLIVCVLGVFTFFRILKQCFSNMRRTLSNNARFLFFSTYLKYVTGPVHCNPNFSISVYVLPKHQCNDHILKNKIVDRHLINGPLYHMSTGRVAI